MTYGTVGIQQQQNLYLISLPSYQHFIMNRVLTRHKWTYTDLYLQQNGRNSSSHITYNH